MRLLFLLCATFIIIEGAFGQETTWIKGRIVDEQSQVPLETVLISFEGTEFYVHTNTFGTFRLAVALKGRRVISVTLKDYVSQRTPVILEGETIDLGTIFLERDMTTEQSDNLVSLTDAELFDDASDTGSVALLQGTRDVFLNTAAFDFGQAFFRVRGYDSRNGQVLINGIPMNTLFDGRPQWNHWGGLNDVVRNQEFTNGLAPSEATFGGILGTTAIDTRPSGLRSGTRISSSVSNRTYTGRLMATHTSRTNENGFTYSISGSRRWAKQGYIDGTLYDAFSFFGAMEYQLSERNSLGLTGIFASNRRGRSAAITEEVFELVGNQYNPYWGEQEGQIRNSRERHIAEPTIFLNHYYTSDKFRLTTGIAYQFGFNMRSRLGYYNAPNPDPTYYRYLPSFYINSPIGANFISANQAKEGFLRDPQLNWENVYAANAEREAAYVLHDDRTDNKRIIGNVRANWDLSKNIQLDFATTYQQQQSENYAKIDDLFGADFHRDIDPFSDTENDVNGTVEKGENTIFNYNYKFYVSQVTGFGQLRYRRNVWNAFLSGNYLVTDYQREGLFQNERFLESSFGKSTAVRFSNYGIKGGFNYQITGRHWATANAAYMTRPTVLRNTFINPRENNDIVPDVRSEKISTVDINYFVRLPKLNARLTGFYTRFQHGTNVNFFFVDAGIGSDFVQEVLTGMDRLHKGIELAMEYEVSSSVKLSFVSAVGSYQFASDPEVSINFDTAAAEEELINLDGTVDLGTASIKGYRLPQGPQQAFSLGISYRDPSYWWVKATTNYLANNYAAISTITRTRSFYLDPEAGTSFPGATDENVNALLAQKPLDDFYLLNLVGGKSWLRKGKYISVFASINNAFNTVFRTGGYEQSRNGNFGQLQRDNLSGSPSFAPKFWYGYGRTYFLNIAFSF